MGVHPQLIDPCWRKANTVRYGEARDYLQRQNAATPHRPSNPA